MKSLKFIEPSKVGNQHITLIEGYLKAASHFSQTKVQAFLSSKTVFNLSDSLKKEIDIKEIFVLDPIKRRLVIKSFVEFFVTLREIILLKKNEVLIVTCILPTALLLLELVSKLFRNKNIFICLHGEIEFLASKKPLSIFRIGFWARAWLKVRSIKSNIKLIVLDDFIKQGLLERFPNKFNEIGVFVLNFPMPVLPPFNSVIDDHLNICFIGYKTSHKRYDRFEKLFNLSKKNSRLRFFFIGSGIVHDLNTNQITKICSNSEYYDALRKMDLAIFPYDEGYELSMSAAMLDAIFCNLKILSTNIGCAASLKVKFPNLVTIINNSDLTETFHEMLNRNIFFDKYEKIAQFEYSTISINKYYGLNFIARELAKICK